MLSRSEFESLYRDNFARLYRYAKIMLGDEDEARDVVSDSFEYLWLNRKITGKGISPQAVLFRTLRTRCIDALRHKKSSRKYMSVIWRDGDDEGFEFEDPRMRRLKNAIEQLPPKTREVFIECFVEGRKYGEAGKKFNISINTVKTHISRALSILRQELSE